MRLIRLGAEPSTIGADVRAALTAWGAGTGVLGGVALIGGLVAFLVIRRRRGDGTYP